MLRLTVKATNPQRRRACRYQPPSSCRFLTQKNSREPGLRNDSQHPFLFKACHVDSLDDRLDACGRLVALALDCTWTNYTKRPWTARFDRPASVGMQRVGSRSAMHVMRSALACVGAGLDEAATHCSVRTLVTLHPDCAIALHALTEYSNRKKGSNIRQKKTIREYSTDSFHPYFVGYCFLDKWE